MTKIRFVLTILFFGSVWGAAEAVLGGLLYGADVPYAAVPLTVIALALLTVARRWCPVPGTSALVASCAMLFKFANAPFWGCHLLGIFLLGGAHDLVLLAAGYARTDGDTGWLRHALVGAGTAYLGFVLFAVLMTYVVRYEYWARGGLARVLDHALVGGTMAAVGAAVVVPMAARFGRALAAGPLARPGRLVSLAKGGAWGVTVALWVLALTVPF